MWFKLDYLAEQEKEYWRRIVEAESITCRSLAACNPHKITQADSILRTPAGPRPEHERSVRAWLAAARQT